MKVLHVCPLWHPISHDAYGGIETLLAQLIPALHALGCESTLLASGDSDAGAVVAALPVNLCAEMAAEHAAEYTYYEQQQLRMAIELAADFDLVHSHIGAAGYVLSAVPGLRQRVLHTVHSPVTADLQAFSRRNPEHWFSTVSEHQSGKLRAADARHCTAIPNGIAVTNFKFESRPAGGLLYIGRIEHVKGPDLAVRVARELKLPLKLAGPIVEPDYFAKEIEPFLGEHATYTGVASHEEKIALFGEASCAVLPFRGDEPFGLVAIEAMACGTPVVTLANGALPEIVDQGITGFIAQDIAELAGLARRAIELDRATVRTRVTSRFDISVAAAGYHKLYVEMIGASR